LDADDDCPARLAPKLLRRAVRVRGDRQIRVVLAKREFENWFMAAAESIARHGYLGTEVSQVDTPEAIRDAKGWLERHSLEGRRYRETVDQAAFAGVFDLRAARGAPSFDKLLRDVESLLRAMIGGG
jgi:hypothetical protein